MESQASSLATSSSTEGWSEAALGGSSEGVLTHAEDKRWLRLVSPLCTTALLLLAVVCNDGSSVHGGLLVKGQGKQEGATCWALSSCVQALLGVCTALKPCQGLAQPG